MSQALQARAKPPKKAEPQVKGQELQEQAQEPDEENDLDYTWLIILGFIAVGILYERRKYKNDL